MSTALVGFLGVVAGALTTGGAQAWLAANQRRNDALVAARVVWATLAEVVNFIRHAEIAALTWFAHNRPDIPSEPVTRESPLTAGLVGGFACVRGCSRGSGPQEDRSGGRKGPQKDRKSLGVTRLYNRHPSTCCSRRGVQRRLSSCAAGDT
jgi:hypothetical protein